MIHRISLDLAQNGIQTTIPFVEGDVNSHIIRVMLRNGGEPITFKENVSAEIIMHRPVAVGDRTEDLVILNNCYLVTEEKSENGSVNVINAIDIPVTQQMLAKEGRYYANLVVHGLDFVSNSPIIQFSIFKNVNKGEIDLSTELNTIDNAVEAVRNMVEQVENRDDIVGEKLDDVEEDISDLKSKDQEHDIRLDQNETAISSKLDKYTGGGYSVYAKTPQGQAHLPFSDGNVGDTIMYRNAQGRSQVSNPVQGKDIANKEYVDEAIEDAKIDVETLQAEIQTKQSKTLATPIMGQTNIEEALRVTASRTQGRQSATICKSLALGPEKVYNVIIDKNSDEFAVGDNILIEELSVPDLWISNIVPSITVGFGTYLVTDSSTASDIISCLGNMLVEVYYETADGKYICVNKLETTKVDVPLPQIIGTPNNVAKTGASGTANTYSRSDHTHAIDIEDFVEPNPTLTGDEESLEALKIGDTSYKIEGGSGGLNLENATGLNALKQTTDSSEENKATTKGSVAMGFSTIAGQKCWYYSQYAIAQSHNNEVYDVALKLTSTQVTPVQVSTISIGSGDTGFQPDDAVYVMNDFLYTTYVVQAVEGDVVFLNNTKQETHNLVIPSDPQRWDYTIFSVENPELGPVDFGECAFSTGHLNQAVGSYAFAEGERNVAIGNYSHVEGRRNIAFGNRAHAEGYDTRALGKNAHAEGTATTAEGYNSHAEGDMTEAMGVDAHTEGYLTIATSNQAHAEGRDTRATGIASHAEGYHTRASGNYSHAEGKGEGDEGFNVASGNFSHVEGNGTTASNNSAHAEGLGTIASGMHSHSEGHFTQAIGEDSHAEGVFSQATGVGSHAEGYKDVNDSTDLGTRATNRGAHAEGRRTLASGVDAHAEGDLTEASGSDSHAEGYKSKAILNQSHAEGRETIAKGWASHSEGEGTIAKDRAQHAAGKFNIEKSGARITGGGTSDSDRYNIEELAWNGDYKIAGKLVLDMNGDDEALSADMLRELKQGIGSGGGDDVSFGTNNDIVVSDGTNTPIEPNPTLAGTEDPLTSILIGDTKYAVGGGSGGLTQDLLWENASPNADFADQTISIPGLQGYKYIVIIYKHDKTNNYARSAFARTEVEDKVLLTYGYPLLALSRYDTLAREVIIYDSSIRFLTCYYANMIATNIYFGNSNGNLIPIKIYGIK